MQSFSPILNSENLREVFRCLVITPACAPWKPETASPSPWTEAEAFLPPTARPTFSLLTVMEMSRGASALGSGRSPPNEP